MEWFYRVYFLLCNRTKTFGSLIYKEFPKILKNVSVAFFVEMSDALLFHLHFYLIGPLNLTMLRIFPFFLLLNPSSVLSKLDMASNLLRLSYSYFYRAVSTLSFSIFCPLLISSTKKCLFSWLSENNLL